MAYPVIRCVNDVKKIDGGAGESKAFVLEQELVGPLGQIVEVDFLKVC